jgi:hypothetical protein
MVLSTSQLNSEIIYPDSDGKPMAESDPTRDYLIYGVEALNVRYSTSTTWIGIKGGRGGRSIRIITGRGQGTTGVTQAVANHPGNRKE